MVLRFVYLVAITLIIVLLFICYRPSNKVTVEQFTTLSGNIPRIPNIIWSYWDQGLDQAPQLVQMCRHNWLRMCPGWKIRMLDHNTIGKYLNPDSFYVPLEIDSYYQKKADMIRLALLEKYGGVWMDSTIFCTQKLDWVWEQQTRDSSTMVIYYLPNFTTNDQFPVFENWFIAATPGHPFIQQWRSDFQSYLTMGYEKYLELVTQDQIDLQNIDNYQYLTMHVSAQRILQRHANVDFKISIISAGKSPFYYQFMVNWNSDHLTNYLTTQPMSKPDMLKIIKLRGCERANLENYLHSYPHSVRSNSIISKYLLQGREQAR